MLQKIVENHRIKIFPEKHIFGKELVFVFFSSIDNFGGLRRGLSYWPFLFTKIVQDH